MDKPSNQTGFVIIHESAALEDLGVTSQTLNQTISTIFVIPSESVPLSLIVLVVIPQTLNQDQNCGVISKQFVICSVLCSMKPI